jgi:hypothetical protein
MLGVRIAIFDRGPEGEGDQGFAWRIHHGATAECGVSAGLDLADGRQILPRDGLPFHDTSCACGDSLVLITQRRSQASRVFAEYGATSLPITSRITTGRLSIALLHIASSRHRSIVYRFYVLYLEGLNSDMPVSLFRQHLGISRPRTRNVT